MAKCFDVVGYTEPCNSERRKYTGRALLIVGKPAGESYGGITFSDNGLNVTGITSYTDFSNFYSSTDDKKFLFPVTINAENPFGVTVQGNTDSGRVMYTKTIPVSIPATRDGKADEFIMGLQNGLYGLGIIVLETRGLDNTNRMDENDIFCAYSPIRLDPTSVTRSEYENGGAWTFNLVCEEYVPNVICTMANLDTTLDQMNV